MSMDNTINTTPVPGIKVDISVGGGGLAKETDPTVPEWAKSPEKPSYTADEVGALSADTLPDAINAALTQAKESGEFNGQDGAQGPAGPSGAAAYNILDNSDFSNPVNQRGRAEYNDTGLSIDRWMIEEINGGTGYVSVEDGRVNICAFGDGIRFTQYFSKKLSLYKYYWFTVTHGDTAHEKQVYLQDDSGSTFTLNYDAGFQVTLTPNYLSIYVGPRQIYGISNIALYDGDYPSAPVYVPKGYGVELAECRRYYRQIGPYFIPAKVQESMFTANIANGMRAVPSLRSEDDSPIYIGADGTQADVYTGSIYLREEGTNIVAEGSVEAADGIGFLTGYYLELIVEWYGESE